MKQLESRWTDFDEILYLRFIFSKIRPENSGFVELDKNNEYFTWWRFHIYDNISLWIILRMRSVLDKSYRENQNTHFMLNNFFSKIVSFMS
jgi:hypothetical protein